MKLDGFQTFVEETQKCPWKYVEIYYTWSKTYLR